MIKNIRTKVLVVLLSLIALYGLTSILFLFYNNEKDKIFQFNNTVKTLQILLLKDAITVNDFFTFEINNQLFFHTGSSFYIEEHRIYMSSITNKINSLLNSTVITKFGLKKQLNDINRKLNTYDKNFNNIVSSIKIRNNEEQERNNQTKNITKIRTQLDEEKILILNEISKISEYSQDRRKIISNELRYIFEISVFIILIIGVIFSVYISKQTTKSIISLSDIISKFVKSKFTSNDDFTFKKRNDEIGQLINNFLILKEEVWNQINFLEENVKKRTKKISEQKERIKEQKEEITSQRDEVLRTNILIEKQNTKILDSIKYAKKIQEAFLPDKETIMKVFPESFILWKPKDLVSGDFYWFKNIKKENISILAAVDCTGHGVPGAFMSMLGNALLNEIILRKKHYNAAIILNILRKRIIDTLHINTNNKVSGDGMDIALLIFNHTNNKLQFAGANRPMFLIRNNELQRIKGDNMSIGKYVKSKHFFTCKDIDIEYNDSIYIFSDGFVDQFDENNERKYMTKKFKELLLSNSDKPMELQKEIYSSVFDEWKGNLEQTDDMLVIGFKPLHNRNQNYQSYLHVVSSNQYN